MEFLVRTGDLWLVFWLTVLAIALLAYVFSKKKEEDRQRKKSQAAQRERLLQLQQQRK